MDKNLSHRDFLGLMGASFAALAMGAAVHAQAAL